jgi:hypothetical protein
MDAVTSDLLISGLVFASLFGIAYVFLTTRHRERMSMLEKGHNAAIFETSSTGSTLKFGMLFTGIAIGILTGYALNQLTGLEETVAFVSMVFLFGGLSLIINYLIDKKAGR